MRLSRRSLLQLAGLGAGGLYLPGLEALRAQDEGSPPKLLFLYSEAGWVERQLRLRPSFAPAEWSNFTYYNPPQYEQPDETEWELDLTDSRLDDEPLSRILEPLRRHRDVMTVVEGLAQLTAALDSQGDAHAQAHIHAWSGVPASSGDGTRSRGSAPSIDQRINEFIRQTDPDHQSMDLRFWHPEMFHAWLYRSDGQGGAARVPVIMNPQDAYDRFLAGTGGQGQTNTDPLQDNSGHALELAMRQFDSISHRLPVGDRQKLESHRDMLSSLQRRLGRSISCDGHMRPPVADGNTEAELYEPHIDAYARIVATAFACGISRVATIGPITAPNETFGLPASASIHEEFEHHIDPRLQHETDGAALEDFFQREEMMTLRNIRQTEMVANIVDIFRSVQDGEGTLLDSTIIVYMSELGHGNHGADNYPTIMFGNAGNMVTPGRYIKYAQTTPIPYDRNYHNLYAGPSHSHLLISLLQAFGMDVDYLGAPNVQATNESATVNLSGPLPRLRV